MIKLDQIGSNWIKLRKHPYERSWIKSFLVLLFQSYRLKFGIRKKIPIDFFFLISFYLFLPIFFLVCNNARSSEKCSAKIAKMVRKNICITICKESYKSVLEKVKSFWCDVGGAWRHAAQRIIPPVDLYLIFWKIKL